MLIRSHLRALQSKFALALLVHLFHVFGHRWRLREVFFWFVFKEVLHELDEVRQRAGRAGHFVAERFLSARIAHPHARYVRRCVAEEPHVRVIVDGAGLARERHAEHLRRRSGPALHDAAHHRNHRQRDVLADNFVSRSLPLFHHCAVAIHDLANHVRLDAYAFVRKSGVSRDHLIERHFGGAERRRKVRRHWHLNAKAAHHL